MTSPEKKHTPDGQPVTSFNIVIYTSEADDSKSGIVKVSATRKLADKAMEEIMVGDTIFVEGKLYTKILENRFSQKQKIPYIQVTNFDVMKSKMLRPDDENNFDQNYLPLDKNISNDDDENIPF